MAGVGLEGSPISLLDRGCMLIRLILTPDWRRLFAAEGKVTSLNPPDLGEGWSEVEFDVEGGVTKRQFPTSRLIGIGADEVGARVIYRHYVIGSDTISTLNPIR